MLYFPPLLGGSFPFKNSMLAAILPFFVFSFASSSMYVFNDVLDAEHDSLHPVKKNRPIPSGLLTVSTAIIFSACLGISSILMATMVSMQFLVYLLVYLIISLCYSLKLKEIPIADIFCIASGFVIRLLAGGQAFGVVVSEWLFLSVFLLAMFLSTGKRLGEKIILGSCAGTHRKCLDKYPDGFLEGTMYLTGATVLVTYTMYSLPHHPLVYSVPLCAYGLLRYMYRVQAGCGGDPTESLLRDRHLLTVGFLWACVVGWSIYR